MLRAAARFHRYSFGNVYYLVSGHRNTGGGIPDLAQPRPERHQG